MSIENIILATGLSIGAIVIGVIECKGVLIWREMMLRKHDIMSSSDDKQLTMKDLDTRLKEIEDRFKRFDSHRKPLDYTKNDSQMTR